MIRVVLAIALAALAVSCGGSEGPDLGGFWADAPGACPQGGDCSPIQPQVVEIVDGGAPHGGAAREGSPASSGVPLNLARPASGRAPW